MGAHLRDALGGPRIGPGRHWTSSPARAIGELTFMPTSKRKYRSGKIVWRYQFAGPGSTRQNEIVISESGFATKQAASAAEAVRRTEEQKKYEMAKAGRAAGAAAAPHWG